MVFHQTIYCFGVLSLEKNIGHACATLFHHYPSEPAWLAPGALWGAWSAVVQWLSPLGAWVVWSTLSIVLLGSVCLHLVRCLVGYVSRMLVLFATFVPHLWEYVGVHPCPYKLAGYPCWLSSALRATFILIIVKLQTLKANSGHIETVWGLFVCKRTHSY